MPNHAENPEPIATDSTTPRDEPRRHPRFLLILGLIGLGSAPFPFIGREAVWFLGLPAWLWWSLGMTVLFAGLTSWGWAHYWRDDP